MKNSTVNTKPAHFEHYVYSITREIKYAIDRNKR